VLSGLAGGLFGVGGGVILVPLLTGRFKLTQHQAHGTSLAIIGLTAIAGVLVYAFHGQVHWREAGLVALSSMFTARLGARLASRTPSVGLSRAFAVLLFVVAIRLLMGVPEVGSEPRPEGWSAVGFDLLLGCGVGLLSGYMGVGGGVLAVPGFTLVMGMTQQAAQGTSLAAIVVTGPAGAAEHARHGNVILKVVPAIVAGAVLGAPLSSWVAQLLPHDVLVRAFAIFLMANAAYTWFRAPRRARNASPELSRARTQG
jgi:hypothetical protein